MLSRIGSILRTLLFTDVCTITKEKLGFARLLVEMEVQGEFPKMVVLEDETGMQISQKVVYKWRPIHCTTCKGDGHTSAICPNTKKKKVTQLWRPKVSSTSLSKSNDEPVVVVAPNPVTTLKEGKQVVKPEARPSWEVPQTQGMTVHGLAKDTVVKDVHVVLDSVVVSSTSMVAEGKRVGRPPS